MVITPHASVGAAAGSYAGNVATAFLAGMASHYLLDAVPHRDYSLDKKELLALDCILAAGLLAWRPRSSKTLAGALGGITPDLIEFGLAENRLSPLRRIHLASHTSREASAWASLAVQSVVVAGAFWIRRQK